MQRGKLVGLKSFLYVPTKNFHPGGKWERERVEELKSKDFFAISILLFFFPTKQKRIYIYFPSFHFFILPTKYIWWKYKYFLSFPTKQTLTLEHNKYDVPFFSFLFL
jgi:hypothetical protein